MEINDRVWIVPKEQYGLISGMNRGVSGVEYMVVNTDGDMILYLHEDGDLLPDKPKQIVQKTMDLWFNFFYQSSTGPFLSKKDADQDPISDRWKCVKVTGHYEEEE